ncbi:MAG: hypothetical protein NTV87_12860 [Ignavibacteriae bacterium]|nr:hypothetical protein [Ignavibacteriota bacterium]
MRKIAVLLVLFSAIVAMMTYGFNFPFEENSTGFNTVKTQSPSNNPDDVSKKLSEGLKFLSPESPNLVSAYTWSQSTGTYSSISGTGTRIANNLQYNEVFNDQPIGFNFQYDGPAYTTFGVCMNGYMSIGST